MTMYTQMFFYGHFRVYRQGPSWTFQFTGFTVNAICGLVYCSPKIESQLYVVVVIENKIIITS